MTTYLRPQISLRAGTVALVLCLTTAVSAQTAYTIADLGSLGGPSWFVESTAPSQVNAFGQVTGESISPVTGTFHAFLYSDGKMRDLGTLGGSSSFGASINNSGQVVGYSDTPGNPLGGGRAFLYSGGTMADLGTLGGTASLGLGINDSGEVTGGASTNGNAKFDVFLYSGGTMRDLGTLGGRDGQGQAINANGQIAGISHTSAENTSLHAFIYSGGTMKDLGTLGGSQSQAFAINNSGQVTGYSLTSGDTDERAFLYSDNAMTDLGAGPSVGASINEFGQVVGNSTAPFLYTPGIGIVDLNTLLPSGSGWNLFEAVAINDLGQVTGLGFDSSNLQHAFLLSPVRVPFSAFDAKLVGSASGKTSFRLMGSFTVDAESNGIDPVSQPVILQLGTLSTGIRTGSFTKTAKGQYIFEGRVGTTALQFRITEKAGNSYTWRVEGSTNLVWTTTNPIRVGLVIGNNAGTVSVTRHGGS